MSTLSKPLDELKNTAVETAGASFSIVFSKTEGKWKIHLPNCRSTPFSANQLETACFEATNWIIKNREEKLVTSYRIKIDEEDA